MICITDGRATSGASEDPVGEAKQWARILGTLPVDYIVSIRKRALSSSA